MPPSGPNQHLRLGLTRRRFIWLTGMSAAGCATNPVTGKSQFMTVSEESHGKSHGARLPRGIDASSARHD